jgi:hypothetical protein
MDVPFIKPYWPPGTVDSTSTPGAASSTCSLNDENLALNFFYQ